MSVTSLAPSARDGTLGGVPTFSFCAYDTAFLMPTVFSIWTAARLLDVRSAVRIVISSAVECSSSGIHPPWGVSMGSFRLVMSDAGEYPASRAAAYTNGLKADPAWRLAWTARLK